MSLHSLGKITTTSGTPKSVLFNQSDPNTLLSCHSFMVQALPTNTGKVYVGFQHMDIIAMIDVLAVLAVPTVNLLPSFSATISYAPAALSLNVIYIDVDVTGEGAVVSAAIG